MDAATRDRFAKVKALMESPNAGEAAAAKARYAAMVEKYGDPAVRPRGSRPFLSENIEPFVNAFADDIVREMKRSDFTTIFNDLFSSRARQAFDVELERKRGQVCGEAVTYIMDELGLDVDGVVGGPWTIYDHTDVAHGPLDQQGVIDFATARGF